MRSIYGHGSPPIGARVNYNLNRWERDTWIDCHICSFSIPTREATVHYRKRKLVCLMCADNVTQADMMEYMERPIERQYPTMQKVKS